MDAGGHFLWVGGGGWRYILAELRWVNIFYGLRYNFGW